jgi:hypothetical protein
MKSVGKSGLSLASEHPETDFHHHFARHRLAGFHRRREFPGADGVRGALI